MDEKVLRQDKNFSSRLLCAINKTGEQYCSLATNTKYNTTEYVIIKIQQLKGKTILKFYQNISNYHAEMIYRRQSNTFHI